jgi:hypothetical protein
MRKQQREGWIVPDDVLEIYESEDPQDLGLHLVVAVYSHEDGPKLHLRNESGEEFFFSAAGPVDADQILPPPTIH